MQGPTRQFSAGQIIFREGEESDAAFVIQQGRVEVLKTGQGTAVRLAVLGPGELLGETGVLDRGPRSATARAETDAVVTVIPRDEFLRRLQTDPEEALRVMSRMAKRLRDTDEQLVSGFGAGSGKGSPGTALALVTPPGGGSTMASPAASVASAIRPIMPKGGLIDRLMSLFRPGHAGGKPGRRTMTIVVTPLSLDPEYDQRPYLIEAMAGLEAVQVRPSKEDLPLPEEGSTRRDPARARVNARQMLDQEKADLVIWGGEDETGRVIELFFTTTASPDLDHPGVFPPESMLILPGDFDDAWSALIKAVALAALGGDHTALPGLLAIARDTALDPPDGMSPAEQAAVLGCFGHACAVAGMRHNLGGSIDLALTAYRRAIARLPRDADAEWTRINRALGILLQARGERLRNAAMIGEAIECYRNALDALHRDDNPKAWAALQARLGTVLFRLDMLVGDEEALKECLTCFKAATQVYTRAEFPWRWAEMMNAIAQALQVYGDHLKSVDVLKKAVELCKSAMEVRTLEISPLLYATTRNNMGSALFLVAKHSADPEYMRLASVAFRDALAAYRGTGATGPLGRTIERNLARAESLLIRHESRTVARPAWAEELPPEPTLEDDAGEASPDNQR